MIKIDNLSVEFETIRGTLKAVRGVSLEINNGEIVCVVGESGSGKSVTAQSILKLLPDNSIKSGTVKIGGQDILGIKKNQLSQIRGNVCSMIFQEPGRSFDPLYSIGKTFYETIRAHDKEISDADIEKKAAALLNEVGIYNAEERLINYPHQLSGGQLQRVMIALAVASDPDYLIADEPTTALDVTIQRKILELIARLRNERKLAVLFITHDLSLVKDFADKVVVMYGGVVLEEGSVDDIFNKPSHPYTEALLNSIPKPGTNYKNSRLVSIEGTVPDPINAPPGCPFSRRCMYRIEKCEEKLPELKGDSHKCRCIRQGDLNA